MKMLTKMMLAASMMLGAVTGALAQDRANLGEAKALAEQAAAHVAKVGPESAFKDFNASAEWKNKDLYVFAYDMKGDCVANGGNAQLIGKNQIGLTDPSGKTIIKDMITAAGKGRGSVDYSWPHPGTKNVENKTTYVVKLANYDGFVGVGAYK